MILYNKIMAKYPGRNLDQILGFKLANDIRDSKICNFNLLVRKIKFSDINYSFKDFQKDNLYKDFKEIKTLYNIFNKGFTINRFSEFIKYSNLNRALLKGFTYQTKNLDFEASKDVIYIECDLSNLEVEKFDKHIELYGTPENLKIFKEKFDINRNILFERYKEKWHLAFDGLLAEYIKYHY